ncbi:hypothetical protein [Sphingobium nicotianae]|uniref:Uncharacterized protein n=1 Tax=Sphingobium nicotianae TaxID=2782607 RepID=A0A9X1IPK6_9SPHN|nr:hypothetical protein [Sphingobium nicotianae]MBT2186119.1 hypothetical protein [Sphingobium nicotianae]
MTYTIFPAAFITLITISLIREPDGRKAAILMAATIVYSGCAALLFEIRLRSHRHGQSPVSEG